MKIVLDTNVLISALLNSNGNPAKILNLTLAGKIIILFDNRILNEYFEVLKRDKFGFTDELIFPLIDFIKNEGLYINAVTVNNIFKDEDDKKFYEVFISGKGNYLVTGNLKHFPYDKQIVNPADFIKIINNLV
jgi:putative PIN family toxin of toxin-antitoxin system